MQKIPYTSLSEDALKSLIEEFVTREGTDYGEVEVSLDKKVKQIINALKRREVEIVYDDESATSNIVPRGSIKAPTRAPEEGMPWDDD